MTPPDASILSIDSASVTFMPPPLLSPLFDPVRPRPFGKYGWPGLPGSLSLFSWLMSFQNPRVPKKSIATLRRRRHTQGDEELPAIREA
ncbi:hypothetical protein CMUS01_09608 [Colletotrichum musicola]|uniref:Uncharacterized protein n=1 Tax=Colletotrichum musicola TaxID=2175873 RepID=A0A8H6NB31_9PEZI|nr:hypothetical protein CMUS01_09608 [Colletotrichum musicola]